VNKRISYVLIVGAVAASVIPGNVVAQESPGGINNVRLFGGFSYLDFSVPGDGQVAETSEDLFGVQGNVTYYFTNRVGLTVDGAFNTGSILPDAAPASITSADLTQTSLLFGPRVVLSSSRALTVEAFGAIGWAIGSIDVRGVSENDLPVFERLDDTVFAASFGASFDAMFGAGNWGVRVAQLEILVASYDETVTSFRYSGGIVGRF
jgi:hypothetical protein